jgi:hypothetical protein
VLSAHPRRDRARKARAARRYRRSLRRNPTRARRARATVFSGINAPGISDTTSSPPDSTGSIGPAHYVEFVNGRIAVYDRNTMTPVPNGTATIDDFVGLPGDDVGDPQVQWDPESSRWYYLTYDDNGTGTFALAFGWSKTADPTPLDSGWCRYTLPTGDLFPDFPKLGHDDTHLIFGDNAFALEPEERFVTARVHALEKPADGAIVCPAPGTATSFGGEADPLQTSNGNDAFAPTPANTSDASPVGYVVSADDPAAVMAWHVGGGPGQTPTLTEDGDMGVTPFAAPGQAPQPGTTNVLDTLTGPLVHAVARGDPAAADREVVWTAHAIDGPGGRSVVRWYELIPEVLTVRQEGTISDPTAFLFNAAVSPAGNGRDAVIVYSASGPALLPAIRVSAHRGDKPAGSVGFPLTIFGSAAPFDDFTCTGIFEACRWGDYPGASPDPLPANSDVVWGTNMYSAGTSWATRNFAVQVQPGGPTAAMTASPGTVDAGQAVAFDASASTDDETPIVDYRWDLNGDGAFETDTGATPSASHLYTNAGTVTARLLVRDQNGDQSETATTVTVNAVAPPPVRPTAACIAARKRRDKQLRAVRTLKKRVKRARTLRSRRRYSRKLTTARSKLKRARRAVTKACA